jgi:beta-lactamase class A
MYPNKQLRWALPNGRPAIPPANYNHHSSVLRTPAYRHLAFTAVVFISIILSGTTQIIRTMASKQIVYQPAKVASTNSVNGPEASATAKVAAPPPQASPQPAVAPMSINHSAAVQAVLDSWKATHSTQQWGVVAQGLGDDKTSASINPSASYNMASVYKLYMMYSLFKKYNLTTFANSSIVVVGRGPTNLKTCVELMIKNSDNPCGEAVGSLMGWSKTNNLLRQVGMQNTNLNNPKGITTTAADAALFLQKFNDGQLMDAGEQQYVTSLMQQQRFRSGIPAGCADCLVADKTGDLGTVRHDVGLVDSAGKKYVLAIMTNGASYAQIAQLTSQIQAAMSPAG